MRKPRIAIFLTCALIASGCASGDAAIVSASQDDIGFGAATQQTPLAFAEDADVVDTPGTSDLAAGEPLSGNQDIAGPDTVSGPASGDAEEAGSDSSSDSTSSTTAPQDDETTTSTTQGQSTTSSSAVSNSTTTTTRAQSTTTTTRAPSTTSTTRAPTTTSTTTTAAPTTTTTTTSTTTTTTTPAFDAAAVYASNCASCHGANGEGGRAISIDALGYNDIRSALSGDFVPPAMRSLLSGLALSDTELDQLAQYVDGFS